MIHEYDEALVEFDETMTRVHDSEVDRIEAERQYLEFLAGNAGKGAGYFQLPSFLTKKQSLKKRVRDLRMQKENGWNNSIKLSKAQPQPIVSQVANYVRQKTKTRPRRQIENTSTDRQFSRMYATAQSVIVESKPAPEMNRSFAKAKAVVLTVQDEEFDSEEEVQKPMPKIIRNRIAVPRESPERQTKRLDQSLDI